MLTETSSPSVQQLLDQGMSPGLHWFPEDVSLSQLATVLVGLANAAGGTVLVGVSPRSARIQGVREPEMMADRIFQAALLCDPPLILPLPQNEVLEQKTVVRIVVPAGLPHVFNLDGRYFVRSGTQTNPMPARQLRALLLARGVVQFESRVPPQAGLADLDPTQMRAYVESLGFSREVDPAEVLLRRGCLQKVDGQLQPTYAGLLLFGRYPEQWLPSATILAARFPGQTISDQFVKQEIRGSLPDQLRQAETFVRDQLRTAVRLIGLTRQETLEYPFEAVRELLVNAVAHRDYNQQGDGVHLHIFADRLEVHSPGGLPGPVNLENLLEARFSRNAVIAQVLSDLGFVERLGYGLNRVVTLLRQQGFPEPRFEEIGGSFRVTITSLAAQNAPEVQMPDLSAFAPEQLNPRQELAIGRLLQQKRITNSDFQALCPDVSAETLRRDLADLVQKGILIKVGQKRATYYILKH